MNTVNYLSNRHFINHRFPSAALTGNDLIFKPSVNVNGVIYFTKLIKAPSDKYQITIHVEVNGFAVFCFQCVNNLKIVLRNGINILNVTIPPGYDTFKAIIFVHYVYKGYTFVCHDISMTKANETVRCSPAVLLVADCRQWCFDHICQAIYRYYHSQFEIYIDYCHEKINYAQKYAHLTFDVVIKFWYGFDCFDPFVLYPKAVKVMAIYDYIHWNPQIANLTSDIYQNFLKNMQSSDVILYACDAIYQLLNKQHAAQITNHLLIAAIDGVDVNQFTPGTMPDYPQLIVGWAGNTANVYKNYAVLQHHLNKQPWIKFVTQPQNRAIKHTHMPQFYQTVNVVVCFSVAEGTPNIILEASASGKPWISTNVGIVQKLIASAPNDCKPGFIIETIDQLIDKLLYLHKHRFVLKQMGVVGRDCVVKHFNLTNSIKVFDSVMKLTPEQLTIKTISTVPVCSLTKTISSAPLNTPKIIIASTQYPRYGGAATCAYQMHKYLINQSIPSMCVFFDNKVKKMMHLLNPNDLPHVYQAPLAVHFTNKNYQKLVKQSFTIYGPEPYLIYAFNCLAPVLCSQIFKQSKIHYMITGCSYIHNDRLMSSTQVINDRQLMITDKMERLAINCANTIVPNSYLTKNIFEHCHQTATDEVIDLHEVFELNSPTFAARKYDLVFICSNYERKVKNAQLIKEILSDTRLDSFHKICIGIHSAETIGQCKNVTFTSLLSETEIVTVLSQSKILLVPSYVETFSIVAMEASQCGCMVLTTDNAACASTINKYFVLHSYEVNDWVTKIETILKRTEYYQKIFYNHFNQTTACRYLWENKSSKQINLICVSSDAPYIGGCATNMYRLIENLKKDARFRIFGIFVNNGKATIDPLQLSDIYGVPLNNQTIDCLTAIKKEITSLVGDIQLVFLKNYKLFPFIQKVFKNAKIIFSPSGLRSVSNKAVYATAIDDLIVEPRLDYTHVDDTYRFVTDNDLHLDSMAIKQANAVVPNSLLSYQLIHKLYSEPTNLKCPIYLTNIIYKEPLLDHFNERRIDVVFCAYDWKRKCKNNSLVVQILNHADAHCWRIVIVGKHHCAHQATGTQSIERYNYLTNDKVMDLFKNCRVLVIPSTYDSSPNVLTEAILMGCNVVTSVNVGNSENLDSQCLVKDYQSVDSWVKTINNCLVHRLPYFGPNCFKITENLKQLFLKQSNYQRSVGIHKIPPTAHCILDATQPIHYVKSTDYSLVHQVVGYDIYFHLLFELSKKESILDVHYLIYDAALTSNIYLRVAEVYPYYPKGVIIWKLKDMASFSAFMNADMYFIRGTYYTFFKQLIPTTSKIYYYPATALKQKMIHPPALLTDQKMEVILHHETNLQPFYNANRYVLFAKFCTDNWVCLGLPRIYHLCFVATADQHTKNHHLFVSFLHYLHAIKQTTQVIYVGDLTKMQHLTKMQLPENTYVKCTNVTHCNSEQLMTIYNQSKINILFSGRDFYPRVICESAACGCYNVALDTLSDGKSFYVSPLGTLISDPSGVIETKTASSNSYVNNNCLWEQINLLLQANYDAYHISATFKSKYNLNNLIQQIYHS